MAKMRNKNLIYCVLYSTDIINLDWEICKGQVNVLEIVGTGAGEIAQLMKQITYQLGSNIQHPKLR